MIVEIKNYGGSAVIVLPKDFLKYMQIKIGDFVDISDIVKK